MYALLRVFIVAVMYLECGHVWGAAPSRPNVLLIVLDDQNAFAGRRDLAPEPVSPNLERLSKRGVTFSNAQCAAPVCNPSRTAFLSGLRPSTSGIYDNSQDKLPQGHRLERATALPTYFRQHGYKTVGGGKVFSSSVSSALGKRHWDENLGGAEGSKGHDPLPPKDQIQVNSVGKHDWAAFPSRRDQMEDWQLAGWAADYLEEKHEQPFFLACGIVKPHTPWFVPQRYFDLFPHQAITIADLADDEAAGLPKFIKDDLHKPNPAFVARRNEVIAAYLAACRYADDCVGRILAGLNQGPHRDNTIVVVCGDNGYQFGEKHSWSKGQLWEGSANVPLVIAGPGVKQGEVCTRPVNLLDLYPTLVELAGLPEKSGIEGVSFRSLLETPTKAWDRPSLTTAGFKNHALRSERWRYIRYADGSEELYDHQSDPLERNNLAAAAEHTAVKEQLRRWLPKHDEPRTKPLSRDRKADD